MKNEKLYVFVFLFIQLFISFITSISTYEENEFLINLTIFIVPLICMLHEWLVNDYGYKGNILLFPLIKKINITYYFVTFFIMGTIPIIIQFYLGHKYRFHHIINNIITIPLTLTFLIKYVYKLDELCNIIEIVNKFKDRIILKISPILLQLSLFYIINFMKSYSHTPAIIYVGDWYITVDGFNIIYLTTVLFIFLICLLYIILFFMKSKKIREYSFREIFPKYPVTGVVLFFIMWGTMAFYETENRLELSYLLSIILVSCAIFVLIILLWMKLDTYCGIKMLYYNIFLIFMLLLYGIITLYFESMGFSKVHSEEITIYSGISAMILVIIVIILVLTLFKSKLENKYKKDIKKHKDI